MLAFTIAASSSKKPLSPIESADVMIVGLALRNGFVDGLIDGVVDRLIDGLVDELISVVVTEV